MTIYPVEKGGVLAKIGIGFCSTVGIPWAFLSSDIGNAYIKGLSGKEVTEIAEQLGKSHREVLLKTDMDSGNTALVEKVVTECAKGFLLQDNETLLLAGIGGVDFATAYKGKNEIYSSCLSNENVRGLDAFTLKLKTF